MIKHTYSSFTIITTFIVLSIIGLGVAPLLNLRLYPGKSKPAVTVSYSMRGASAIAIDSEVTSPLEGVLSRVSGLQNLKSRTSAGSGWISLELDKKANMDEVRFEVAMLIRQIYPELPENVSYPSIRVRRPDDESTKVETLMTYTLSGPGNNSSIGAYAREVIKPALSQAEGIQAVQVYGVNSRRINLVYDTEMLRNIGLTPYTIANQIRDYSIKCDLGRVYEHNYMDEECYIPVVLDSKQHSFDAEAITISHEDRLFKLSDLVRLEEEESQPQHYYRINGLNTINIVVQSAPQSNQIASAALVREQAKEISKNLPEGYSLNVAYDSSIQLRQELSKIILRVVSSLFILLLFVLLISRSVRYLLIICLSIIANLLIAFILYYSLGIEVHMYSLAGITISLGIIIDNTIIMADHLRRGESISIFRAILAATLTTIGALMVIFFLDENLKLKLIDFAWVIIINLGVSLLVSLFFIPALLDKLPLNKDGKKPKLKVLRRKVRISNIYVSIILFMRRFRWAFLLIALLAFGLPVNKLPSYIKGEQWYINWYNGTIGSQYYNEKLKPVVDVALGGSLRLFTDKVKHSALSNSNRRTSINVSASMNDGSTLKQTNAVFNKLENFLSQFDKIEQFETRISSPTSAAINITFKPEHEYDGFPYELKSQLEGKAIELGSADWRVTGVGRGFDNSLNDAYRNSRIVLYGYNLEDLKNYAEKTKDLLEEIPRVEEGSIFINGRASGGGKIHRAYFLDLAQEDMQRRNISQTSILSNLAQMSKEDEWVMASTAENETKYVYMKPMASSLPDFWMINNHPIDIGGDRTTRLQEWGTFYKQREQDLINKENMEYTMVVEYNFIGSYGQKEYIIGTLEKRIHQNLPVGYRIKQQYYRGGYWQDETKDNSQLWLILLIIVIIFFICAIVFESLRQPLAVLSMIPLSFIGVFMTFYWFKLGFDQGGYASFLLLSGLTVNSALYIINELNALRQKHPKLSSIKTYLKAYNYKIIPIILTLSSTIFGLVPFLSGGKKEAFWFSLAAGTIGGLLFSLFVIIFYLPLFVKGINRPLRNSRKRKKLKKQ